MKSPPPWVQFYHAPTSQSCSWNSHCPRTQLHILSNGDISFCLICREIDNWQLWPNVRKPWVWFTFAKVPPFFLVTFQFKVSLLNSWSKSVRQGVSEFEFAHHVHLELSHELHLPPSNKLLLNKYCALSTYLLWKCGLAKNSIGFFSLRVRQNLSSMFTLRTYQKEAMKRDSFSQKKIHITRTFGFPCDFTMSTVASGSQNSII